MEQFESNKTNTNNTINTNLFVILIFWYKLSLDKTSDNKLETNVSIFFYHNLI